MNIKQFALLFLSQVQGYSPGFRSVVNLNYGKVNLERPGRLSYNSVLEAFNTLAPLRATLENLSAANKTLCNSVMQEELRLSLTIETVFDKLEDTMFAYVFHYADYDSLENFYDSILTCMKAYDTEENAEQGTFLINLSFHDLIPYASTFNMDFTSYVLRGNSPIYNWPTLTLSAAESRSYTTGLKLDYYSLAYDFIFGANSEFANFEEVRPISEIKSEIEDILNRRFVSYDEYQKWERKQRKLYWLGKDNEYEYLRGNNTKILYAKYRNTFLMTNDEALRISQLAGLEEEFFIISDQWIEKINSMPKNL